MAESASVNPAKKKRRYAARPYQYRPAVQMGRDLSKKFCEAAKISLPADGFKKVHVNGACKRLNWSVQFFQRVYHEFRALYVGKPDEMVSFFLQNQLLGNVWARASFLEKMLEVVREKGNLPPDEEKVTVGESVVAQPAAKKSRVAGTRAVGGRPKKGPEPKRGPKPKEWTLESQSDDDAVVYSTADARTIIEALDAVVNVVYGIPMTEYVGDIFLKLMKRKPLAALTQGIHEEDLENLLKDHLSRPAVSAIN